MNTRQNYYEYEVDSSNWHKKEVPFKEPWFQDELTELAGLNPFGKPILRVEWAGKLLHDITQMPQLKYKLMANIVTGYYYMAADGKIKVAKDRKLAVDADPNSFFVPRKDAIELGRLRWVIERWVSAEELRKQGRFVKLHDATGNKILRDLPPEGIYDHFFWVQTAGKKFRDLDRDVLTAIQAMWLYNINTSGAQKTLDDMERQKTQTLIGAQEASQVWQAIGQN